MTKPIVHYIQNHDLTGEIFLFINKGLIREVLDKLEEGFYPESVSMNDEGEVLIEDRIAEEQDFTEEQLSWFFDMSENFIGGVGAPFALVGCVNRLKKEFEEKEK